jgi:DNA-binding FadR family transcriptional regulator
MQVIRMLVSDLQLGIWTDKLRVGTEDELCQRYGVSRQVLRQAIRVLENHGLIESQRGRSHGVVVTKPSPVAVIEQVVAYFSSLSLGKDDVCAAKYMLTRLICALAAAKATPHQNRLLLQYIDAVSDWNEPRNLIGLMQLTVNVLDNPFVGLMFQSFHSYVARLGERGPAFLDEAGVLVGRMLRERQLAVIGGDLCRADEIFEEIYVTLGQPHKTH